MKILLIEDEQELRKVIKEYLQQEGYVIESAADFQKASEKTGIYDYDCVLVDITLPDGNGLDIIRQLKQGSSKAGIIIISAKDSLDDKISGLSIGADDYLAKPFHLSELNARIKALIRRKSFSGDKEIVVNEITIIPESFQVFINNNPIALTKKEYDLLMYLLLNKNKVLTKEAIAEHLWGDHIDSSDSFDFVYTHVKNLRKKFAERGATDYIQTVYGLGYKFQVN